MDANQTPAATDSFQRFYMQLVIAHYMNTPYFHKFLSEMASQYSESVLVLKRDM